jgi:catechol 2,3-dioxygenase-like lactoylglutathione lyase family enzyme
MSIPVFRLGSRSEMSAFYETFLGFSVDWQRVLHGYTCVQVSRDGLVLHLIDDGTTNTGRAFAEVYGLSALRDDVLERRHPEYSLPPITSSPFGQTLAISDPFGNTLVLTEIHRRVEPEGQRLDYCLVRIAKAAWRDHNAPEYKDFVNNYLDQGWRIVLSAADEETVELVLYRPLITVIGSG